MDRRRRFRLWLRRLLLGTAGLIALWLMLSVVVAWKLTRRSSTRFDPPPNFLVDLDAESFRLKTCDQEELGAWFIEADADQPVVLLLHGNGGDRGSMCSQAEMLVAAGNSVVMITHRAHGDSTGERNDFGYSARHDVVAALEWIGSRFPQRRVVVWGQSLGSAAAIFAASQFDENVSGLILECPYRDLMTAVHHRTDTYLPPVLSDAAYYGLSMTSYLMLPNGGRHIAPIREMTQIPKRIPVLILVGELDSRAPAEEAREMASQCLSEVEVVVIENADHLQLHRTATTQYEEVVQDWLELR